MVANSPLLSSCRSVIWCQNYGAGTRICENSLSLVKRIKCSGGRNERKFLKFIVGDGMSKQSKFLVLEICPELFVISLPSTAFCSLWQKMLLWSALLLQLPCINQKVMLFFSLSLLPSLSWMPLSCKWFFTLPQWILQIFSHFHHHGT